MRVLIVGSANPWRMEAATERALRRAGHETLIVDDRRIKHRLGWRMTQHMVRARARHFRPDFVILSKCSACDLETVSAVTRGLPNSMWYGDPYWYREIARPDIAHIAAVGRLAQTFFVFGFEEEWRALGLNAKYLPGAGDASIVPVAADAQYASDIAFMGTGYDESRAALLVHLSRCFDVRVYGLGWEKWRGSLNWSGGVVEREEFARVCSSAKITLGINPSIAHGPGASRYISDRPWMVMLAGAFHLAQGTPGLRTMLRDGVHCAWFSDADECAALARHYLEDEPARARIRAAGERFVRAHHTYDQRIANLLSGEEWVDPLDGTD